MRRLNPSWPMCRLAEVANTLSSGPLWSYCLVQCPVAQDRTFVCLGSHRTKASQAIANAADTVPFADTSLAPHFVSEKHMRPVLELDFSIFL